jgi:hypothetical protein
MATTYKTRVLKNDQETYDAECACGFTSSGWALKKHATERIDAHRAEHETGEVMSELHDFRAERGLNPDASGVIGFDDSEV